MKTALIIRHVPHEGIAGFRKPVEAAGYTIDRVDVTDPQFGAIDLREPDLLIMMGGPMAVYDQDRLPWIRCQLARLSLRLEQERPTLGVCLGAQMIAAALGGTVFPGPIKEVGFHKIAVADTPGAAPLRHVADVPLLHWHGDTFCLPQNTELLASSDRYANQAFRRGNNVLGLQFHAEMGEDPRFDVWADAWPEDIAAAGQTADLLRCDYARYGPQAVKAGQSMITQWLAQLT